MTRRKLVSSGVAAFSGVAGLTVAGRLAKQYGLVPPDGGGIYGPGHRLTYGVQKLLTGNALAREFPRSAISDRPFANGRPPKDENYLRMKEAGFVDWRLKVDGMVERPSSFSVAELKSFVPRTQITHLACEEGWSFIAEWMGVPLSAVLERVGVRRGAKYVMYFSIQPEWWDSVDIDEAVHPQTLVTYGMNGGELPVGHGGPVRMRVPRQLGYKSVKFVNRLTVTDSVKGFGKGMGSVAAEYGYSWYNGI
ncbi:MAG: oxidoreductase [Acidimicrobiia bacterium]|nr:oxidoreductase [Acidimicrobiia bacterium]